MIDIQLTHGPIELGEPSEQMLAAHTAGAVVRFTGVVRGEESGAPIAGLFYEAFEPMAISEMKRILDDIATHHEILDARVVHRLGFVPVGQAAIAVEVCTRHREGGLASIAEFMTRMKRDAPIWKVGTTPR